MPCVPALALGSCKTGAELADPAEAMLVFDAEKHPLRGCTLVAPANLGSFVASPFDDAEPPYTSEPDSRDPTSSRGLFTPRHAANALLGTTLAVSPSCKPLNLTIWSSPQGLGQCLGSWSVPMKVPLELPRSTTYVWPSALLSTAACVRDVLGLQSFTSRLSDCLPRM